MDITVDADDATPHLSKIDLPSYWSRSNHLRSNASPPCAADHQYNFGDSALETFDDPSDSVAWSDEEAAKYIVADHPMVMDDHEAELALSDHSHTTPSDTNSRDSSSSYYTPGPLEDLGSTMDSKWRNFSIEMTPNHAMTFPPNPQFLLPESDFVRPLTINPSDTSLSSVPLPAKRVISALSKSRSPLSASSPQPFQHRRHLSISELSMPYIPDQHKNPAIDTDLLSTSDGFSVASNAQAKHTYSRSLPKLKDHDVKRRRPSYLTPSTASDISPPMPKRPKRSSTFRPGSPSVDVDDDEEESDIDDDDVYLPSKSPSPELSTSEYSGSLSPPLPRPLAKSAKKARGKALTKMSAAGALAQLSATSSKCSSGSEMDPDGEGQKQGSFHEAKGRRHHAIPLPIPVPHLIKKSRGRKVPYVDARTARGSASDDDNYDNDSGVRGTPSRKGRGGSSTKSRSAARTFVCTVAGCGKCFVRGEHLKRHVRSIHTHERPHPCPYDGCEKSFSRRDNLGQHVRLHLLGSA